MAHWNWLQSRKKTWHVKSIGGISAVPFSVTIWRPIVNGNPLSLLACLVACLLVIRRLYSSNLIRESKFKSCHQHYWARPIGSRVSLALSLSLLSVCAYVGMTTEHLVLLPFWSLRSCLLFLILFLIVVILLCHHRPFVIKVSASFSIVFISI